MVQRKVSNKLGIQADHVNSLDNRVGNLKQVNSQNQDGRNNRGAPDLKKKMKKSRSIKLSESLRSSSSSPLKQNISLPGKPPPQTPDVLANASSVIQPKQSMMKTSEGSKNYMKSTTSSDARKERAQVSPQTGSDSKNPSRKNLRRSKPDSSSGNKPARSLTRSSSLKLVRTLTKTPSFKHVRSLSAAKKCSKVALCAQKATCSSTLKDTKFPSYLMLNPGGSELDGTSVMKVCPYTYCSLNGHYHTPLPPLKCFLSAKRRLLKTQKNMKLEALSPWRVEASKNGTKKTNTEKVVSDGKPSFQEEGLGSSAISTLIRDGSMDFFIEIYARDKDDTTETTGSGIDDDYDQKTTDFTGKMEGFDDIMSSVGGVNERTEEYGDKQDAESISDGSTHFEIHFEDNLDQNIQISSEGMNVTESFDGELEEEEKEEEYADEGYPSFFPQEETTLQYIDNGSDGEGEFSASVVELDKSDSEASDMEWEEEPFTASHFDNEGDDTTQTGDEVDLNVIHPSKVDNPDLLIKSNFESDDAVSNCFEEIVADELLQEVCEEESASFELKFVQDESGPDEVNQDLDDEEFSQASDTQSHDQLTFPNDASEESIAAEEKYIVAETDEHAAASASIKEINEGLTAASEGKNAVCSVENEILIMDPQPAQGDTNCTTVVADEAFITDHQENEFEQDDDAYALLKNQTTDFTHGFNETDQDESNEGQIQEQESIGYKNEVTEKSRVHDKEINESLHPETENSQTTIQYVAISDFGLEQQLSGADIGDSMDKSDQDSNSLLEIHITVTEPSLVCSEAKQEASVEDYTESHDEVIKDCQDDANAEDSELGQHFVDGSLLSVTQDHAFDIQLQNQNGAENQNHSVKDHCEAEFKSPNSMDSEEQKDSDLTLCSLAEPSIGEVDDMEMEGSVVSDAMETCLRTDTVTNAETGNKSSNVRINTNQEHPETRKTLKGSIKCKPVKDLEEQKDFNPREPNYLSVESDPEAEKVDLRPQMIDERKNAEEWMLDYALQQAVTKLAPARKRRVALLVEAFETVKPIPKYETHRRHSSPAFSHVRPLQTCI